MPRASLHAASSTGSSSSSPPLVTSTSEDVAMISWSRGVEVSGGRAPLSATSRRWMPSSSTITARGLFVLPMRSCARCAHNRQGPDQSGKQDAAVFLTCSCSAAPLPELLASSSSRTRLREKVDFPAPGRPQRSMMQQLLRVCDIGDRDTASFCSSIQFRCFEFVRHYSRRTSSL